MEEIVKNKTAAHETYSKQQKEESFKSKISRFVQNHKEVLEHVYSSSTINKTDNSELLFGTPPPLGYHMITDIHYRTQRALQLMTPGRIIEGFVTQINSNGLHVKLNNFTKFPTTNASLQSHAQLIDLRLKGLVKLEYLTTDPAKCKDVLMDYRVDDVIRGVVLDVDDDIVQLSFIAEDNNDIKLGYIDKELPVSVRIPTPSDYMTSLTSSTDFRNPSCIDNVKHVLGISSSTSCCSSLLRPLLMTPIKENEYFDSLRKSQRYRWSMDMVGTGVTLFKINRYFDALKYYNYALEIDSSNEEALVARGALYVKRCMYEKAIIDFESALTLNHSHSNAKKYLVEAQTRHGKELEEKGDIKGALRCYREALADSPLSEPAKTRAELLTSVIEKQALEKREKEKRKQDEETRLKKLQKIIEKEHHEKKRKKKSKKKRRHSNSSSSSSPEISSHSKRHKH